MKTIAAWKRFIKQIAKSPDPTLYYYGPITDWKVTKRKIGTIQTDGFYLWSEKANKEGRYSFFEWPKRAEIDFNCIGGGFVTTNIQGAKNYYCIDSDALTEMQRISEEKNAAVINRATPLPFNKTNRDGCKAMVEKNQNKPFHIIEGKLRTIFSQTYGIGNETTNRTIDSKHCCARLIQVAKGMLNRINRKKDKEAGIGMKDLTEFGSTTESGFWPSENWNFKRYVSVPTNNEPYYQVQYSIEKLTLRSYCEGDTTKIVSPNLEVFKKEIASVKKWIKENS